MQSILPAISTLPYTSPCIHTHTFDTVLPEQNSALFNENTFLTTLGGFVVSQSGTAQVLRKLKGLDLRTKCGCRTVEGGNKNNLPDEIQIKISFYVHHGYINNTLMSSFD